ncbi:MAG: class I SAM-dependent methyltransferase [Conexivisphaerales archaeon]
MFHKIYSYIINHPKTKRGMWGEWFYQERYQKVLKSILKLSAKGKKATILDLGCGNGLYIKYLMALKFNCYYIGCDKDLKALKEAPKGENVHYVRCDIQNIPFKTEIADVALCSEVLEHLANPYKASEQIIKTTRHAIILTFPDEGILFALGTRHPEHVTQIELKKVLNLLLRNNFKPIELKYIFFSSIPCGILEFLNLRQNSFTKSLISLINNLLKKMLPHTLIPHKTILLIAIKSYA